MVPQRDAAAVDYDELAWELEKCLTYHFVSARSQVIMNEEACMSRKGLDPVSRKTKTPGRKKAGFCVFIAYQLLDSVTTDQGCTYAFSSQNIFLEHDSDRVNQHVVQMKQKDLKLHWPHRSSANR